jgi:hypothetical protein
LLSPEPVTHHPNGSVPLSVVLIRLANDNSRERISVGDLLAALGDRAIGALMFFFAAPNILPVPPGVSTLLGAPLLFLSAQLMLGMRPWLPSVITQRSISRDDLGTLVRRIVPWLAKAEKLLKPRAPVLVRPPVEYVVRLVCLVLAAILMLPIPLGNTLPALAIFASCWILAPFFIGLIFAMLVLLVKFGKEMVSLLMGVLGLMEHDAIISILTLVDTALIAVELLKAFLVSTTLTGEQTGWKIAIHLTFVISGLLFAASDWISDHRESL